MGLRTYRLEFLPPGYHPGDHTVEFEGAICRQMLFESMASVGTLGRCFAGVAPDETSWTCLLVHFEAGSDEEFTALCEKADELFMKCWQQEYENQIRSTDYLGGPSRYFWETYPLVVKDVAGDAERRRALWLWSRGVMWRLNSEGWIIGIQPHFQDGVTGPVAIFAKFHAALAVDPDAMTNRFGVALARERQRLEAGPAGDSSPTPWP